MQRTQVENFVNPDLQQKLSKLAGKPVGFAVIGGTGFEAIAELKMLACVEVKTPFAADVNLTLYQYQADNRSYPFVFLPRHGAEHHIAPHKVNYRANLWALKAAGIAQVLALNAVGGIRDDLAPGTVCLPDQIIDYSHGRESSFFDGDHYPLDHIDFSEPLSGPLYSTLKALQLEHLKQDFVTPLCYGCTQGPRLETAAEIQRLKRDGVHIVGMTLMPEAALARELSLDYCSLAMVVNWAAGLGDSEITMDDIYRELGHCKAQTTGLLWHLLPLLA